MILEFFGYDRHGEVTECKTTLEKNALNTRDVALAALGFNAPAWIAAVSMSVLYSVVGAAAPLVLLISFLFPMLVLALCLVYLTRAAPSAGGIFTFSSRFLHPAAWRDRGRIRLVQAAFARAAAASVLPLLAIFVLGYLMYSAGAEPADPRDKYQAWYIGAAVLISGALSVLFGKSPQPSTGGDITQQAGVPIP